MSRRKQVLVLGGGVAAFAAAMALAENSDLEVTVATAGHRWGGRASSWRGKPGTWSPQQAPHGSPQDFAGWDQCVLNHGFHVVFHYYPNFRDMLSRRREETFPHLIPHDGTLLVYEGGRIHKFPILPLPPPFHCLAGLWYGGMNFLEKWSFFRVITRNFVKLPSQVDRFADQSFTDWCLERGLRPSVIRKNLYRFINDATFISPHEISATAALRAGHLVLRNARAMQYDFINGGITEVFFNPLADYLREKGVRLHFFQTVVDEGIHADELTRRVTGITVRPSRHGSHYVRDPQEPETHGHDDEAETPHEHGAPQHYTPDYVICTFPVENLLRALSPRMRERPFFQRMQRLKTAGTVSLQAWFLDPVIPAEYTNVIFGLEPLSTLVDYKRILPMYRDDPRYPGTVLELVGSFDDLPAPYRQADPDLDNRNWNDPQWRLKAATELLRDHYGSIFPELREAVKAQRFLFPPFLWRNHHPHNRFFLTLPGSLGNRPSVETPYSNFFLAGDWIRNGFDVQCMEGAAISGKMAANAVLRREGFPEAPVLDPYKD